LTPEEVQQVLQTFPADYQGHRNKALFLVGLRTGFRVSELLRLRVQDILHHGRLVDEVTIAKRHRKQRTFSHTVALHQEAKQALQTWLQVYQGQADLLSGVWPLFPARQGLHAPLGRCRAWQILREAFAQAGLSGKLGTHVMRKSYAVSMSQKLDGNIFKVCKALGHVDIKSTMAYMPDFSEEIRRAQLA
jgi:site-specific recombinase XerD